MRKIVFVLFCTIILSLTGCSSAKPETTVKDFIEDGKTFNIEQMASYINPANKFDNEEISNLLADDADELQKYILEYLKFNATKITYTINDAKIENDKAIVQVDFKYVDAGLLFKAVIGEYFTQVLPIAFSGVELTDDDANQMIITAIKKQREIIDETFIDKTIDIKCIKIDDKWYIDQPSDEMLDVFMSNLMTLGKEFSESFGTTTDRVED